MRSFLCFLLVFLVFVPLNLTLGTVGGKPLDFVPSDLLFLLLPLSLSFLKDGGRSQLVRQYTLWLYVYLTYCIAEILFLTDYRHDRALLSLLSFFRAIRPFFLFYIGYMVHFWSQGKIEKWSCSCAMLMSFSLFISDIIFSPRFPNPRWGGALWGLEPYGFPNSPAFFYVVCLAVLLFSVVKKQQKNPLFIIALILLGSTIIFTGSRNALVSFVVLLLWLFFVNCIDRKYIVVLFPLIGVGIYIINMVEIDLTILTSKAERTETEGLMYGRTDVWESALSLVLEKPLFGYAFEGIENSNFDFGTTHNQYIEYLYKTGLFGTLLIAMIWAQIGKSFYFLSRKFRPLESGYYEFLFAAFVTALVSNMAQPNFTYTVTQAFFVFFAGVAAARLSPTPPLDSSGQSNRTRPRIRKKGRRRA